MSAWIARLTLHRMQAGGIPVHLGAHVGGASTLGEGLAWHKVRRLVTGSGLPSMVTSPGARCPALGPGPAIQHADRGLTLLPCCASTGT